MLISCKRSSLFMSGIPKAPTYGLQEVCTIFRGSSLLCSGLQQCTQPTSIRFLLDRVWASQPPIFPRWVWHYSPPDINCGPSGRTLVQNLLFGHHDTHRYSSTQTRKFLTRARPSIYLFGCECNLNFNAADSTSSLNHKGDTLCT